MKQIDSQNEPVHVSAPGQMQYVTIELAGGERLRLLLTNAQGHGHFALSAELEAGQTVDFQAAESSSSLLPLTLRAFMRENGDMVPEQPEAGWTAIAHRSK